MTKSITTPRIPPEHHHTEYIERLIGLFDKAVRCAYGQTWPNRDYDAFIADSLSEMVEPVDYGVTFVQVWLKEPNLSFSFGKPPIGLALSLLTNTPASLYTAPDGIKYVAFHSVIVEGSPEARRRSKAVTEPPQPSRADEPKPAAHWVIVSEVGKAGSEREQREIAKVSLFLGPILVDIFRNRERVLASCPPAVRLHYWEFPKKSDNEELQPPWVSNHVKSTDHSLRVGDPNDNGKQHSDSRRRTATLVVDIRKSTFCMDHADDPVKFGDFLTGLVQDLQDIGHYFGGFFDKFTGDGGMIHFLHEESTEIYGHDPVMLAMECSLAIQYYMSKRIKHLKKLLHIGHRDLGIGIGMDVDQTYWSLDPRNNPITIGKAVVYSHRLCGNAGPGEIAVTNHFYTSLKDAVAAKTKYQPPSPEAQSQKLRMFQTIDNPRVYEGQTWEHLEGPIKNFREKRFNSKEYSERGPTLWKLRRGEGSASVETQAFIKETILKHRGNDDA